MSVVQSVDGIAGPITRSLSARLVVLIVEESSTETARITSELERSGYSVTAEQIRSPEELLSALEKNPWDVIISAAHSAALSGVAVVQILRERQVETPVVLLTDGSDEVTSLESIAAGAEDVLKREDLYRLPYVVGRILQHQQIRQDQAAMLRTARLRLHRRRGHGIRRAFLISFGALVAALAVFTFWYVPSDERLIAGAGITAVSICVALIAWLNLVMPMERLREAAAKLSTGSLDVEMPRASGELGDIAVGLDTLRKRLKKSVLARQSDMVQRLRAEEALRQVHLRLHHQIDATQSRAREFTLLAEMGALLQACARREESYPVLTRFAAALFPGSHGRVYLSGTTRELFEPVAHWGAGSEAGEAIGSDQCWALRRGQVHATYALGNELRCAHAGSQNGATLCVPLLAQASALGVLCLSTAGPCGAADEAALPQSVAEAAGEQIAVSLANLLLREELRELSMSDPLTGLYNRRFLLQAMAREIQRAEREQDTIGMIVADLDFFKQVNDRFGHDAGDTLLKAVANTLHRLVRGSDVACRLGGEEFALLLPGASFKITELRAEEVRREIAALRVRHLASELPGVSLSCGVAVYPEHGANAEVLLRAADQALYRAKESGRDRVASAA